MTDILEYEGLYAITRDGKVWSYKKYGQGAHPAQFKTLLRNKRGYLHVNLFKNAYEKSMQVHRLVAIAYIPNPENKAQVNHINGVKNDNRVENLEWCSNKENFEHAVLTGLRDFKGSRNSQAKITEEIVYEIRKLFSDWKYKDSRHGTRKEYVLKNNISIKTVRDICAYRRWPHIK